MTRFLLILVASLSLACSGGSSGSEEDSIPADDAALEESTSGCEEGLACDDGDPCTSDDKCVAGACAGGAPVLCEHFECFEGGGCDGAGGCDMGTLMEGWCFIGGLCAEAGDSDPEDPCFACDPEQSTDGWSEAPTGTSCEDGNPCTIDDFCDHGDCLNGSPPSCADGIMCTDDECDPVEGCQHAFNHDQCNDDNPCTKDECSYEGAETTGCLSSPDDSLVCGDGNVCTLNDRCEEGSCVSDAEPMDCDDDNPCTDDSCHEAFGCLYVFNENACDDGADCTMEDVCYYGKCVGEEDWWNACPPCTVEFSEQIAKVFKLRVGDGGWVGEAVNVDNDLKTCSPNDTCEQGLDNMLAFAGPMLNSTIEENLQANTPASPLIFVAEFVAPTFDGAAFTVNILYCGLSDSNPDCDFMTQTCTYQASSMNFDDLCKPNVSFNNVTITDGHVSGGGSGYIFPFNMTFVGGATAETVLYSARIEAEVETDDDGNIVTLKGALGGAVTKTNLKELVVAIPDEYMPVPKEAVLDLIDAPQIKPDIDLNGDGEADALSVGLAFETLPGVVVPYNQ